MNLMKNNLRGELTLHSDDQKFEVKQDNLIKEEFNN